MGDANIWRLVYRGLCDLLVNMGAWEASLSTGAVGHLQAGRRIKEALPNVERLLAMVAQEIVDGQIDRPVAEAGALRVQWNHDGAGQPTRIVSVTVGDKRFVPDASVTDTDHWAVNVLAAAKLAAKGDVREPPKQSTFVDDLLWEVFSTADSSDLWGHARREIDIFRSAVRRVLDKHGVDTSVWPAQAASVVALEAVDWQAESVKVADAWIALEQERSIAVADLQAEVVRLNRMLDEKSRIIEAQAYKIEQATNPHVKHAETRLDDIIASASQLPPDEGIPFNELPDDLRTDMQAMDVAEAKSQLASDEGLKVARVLVAKLRKKYDQDVVQGIVDDLIRTKQTGAGLYGLSPGEKEFVCLSRVHIADDPTPRIPVFFSGHQPPVQDDPAVPSAVDHPAHYGGADNPYEAIKVIEAWNLEFCTGSAVKYIARAGKKDATKLVEDLQKAVWYLRRRIEQLAPSERISKGVDVEMFKRLRFLLSDLENKPIAWSPTGHDRNHWAEALRVLLKGEA